MQEINKVVIKGSYGLKSEVVTRFKNVYVFECKKCFVKYDEVHGFVCDWCGRGLDCSLLLTSVDRKPYEVLHKKLYERLRHKNFPGLGIRDDYIVLLKYVKVKSIIEAERFRNSPYKLVPVYWIKPVFFVKPAVRVDLEPEVLQGLITYKCKKEGTNLYIVVLAHRIVKEVNAKEFAEGAGPVLVVRNKKFKLQQGTRKDFEAIRSSLLSGLSGHTLGGIVDALRDTFFGVQRVVGVMNTVLSREKIKETQLLLADWISFLLQQCSGTYNNWTVPYLTGFLVRIATLYARGKHLIGQSLDGVFMLAAAAGLPTSLATILKNLSLLTTKRIGDHPNLILDFVVAVSEYMCLLIDGACWLPANIKYCLLRVFRAGFYQRILYRINVVYDRWEKNKAAMLENEFRQGVLELKKLADDQENLSVILSTNTKFKLAYDKLVLLVRAVKSYEKCSRQEPVCVVLEGPPGVKKTIAALQTIQLLGRSTYTHIIKPTEDGKDFYDGYNNEDVFVMDDVGQQGMSQWRTIINMVSSLKLPLDCAEVSLKDTKYFDSRIMLLTTNSFSSIHGLTKSDGIAEITALWRRAHVVKFLSEKRAEYHRFDIYKGSWCRDFPRGFAFDYPTVVEGTTEDIAEWMTGLVLLLEKYYDGILQTIEMSEHEVQVRRARINDRVTYMEAQDLTGMLPTFTIMWDTIRDWTEFLYDSVVSWVPEIVDINTSLAMAGALGLALLFKNLFSSGVSKTTSDSEAVVQKWRSEVSNRSRTPLILPEGQVVMQSLSPGSTIVEAVKKNIKIVTVITKEGNTQTAHGLASGCRLFMVSHTVRDDKGKLIIYKDDVEFINGNREYDLVPYKTVFRDKVKDLVVLELPTLNLTPYANVSKHLGNKNYELSPAKKLWFVWAGGVESLEGACFDNLINADYKTYEREVRLQGALAYNFGSPGFCGSLIVDEVCGIVGVHVAGKEAGFGVARVFPKSERQLLISKLNSDTNVSELDETEWVAPVVSKFSGMIRRTEKRSDGPKTTHFKPSIFHGVFPITKEPANLRSLGDHTVKLRALRNHKTVVKIPDAELDFMRKYVRQILPAAFRPITEKQVVLGIRKENEERLAPINKDSVSGFDFPMDKRCYFDFSEGIPLPNFKDELIRYRVQAQDGYPDAITQHHTLKDELRVKEKVSKPRTFGVDSLTTQFEMKRLLGEVMMHIRAHRMFSGCMIGVNPYVEFNYMHGVLKKAKYVWDGDIGEYDASVSPEVQDMLNEELIDRFDGEEEDKNVLRRVLELSVRSWVVAGNREYMKTHGILSGMWITNLFNSIINRCYTAGWYYREMVKRGLRPDINKFFDEVTVYVQGDDQLCAVGHTAIEELNAVTMAQYYESLGMTYTDGKKGAITRKSMPLEEVSFLKRRFAYHVQLEKVVGILDLETITNSLMWYKDDNDPNEILTNKLRAAQMELYLHRFSVGYQDLGKDIERKMLEHTKKKSFVYVPWPDEYLYNIFKEDPDATYELYLRLVDKRY